VAADSYPVIVYDGRCRFCVQQATRLARWAGGRVRLESFREPGVLARHPGLTAEACEAAVQLIERDGRVRSGAAAVARALELRPELAPFGWLYRVPLLRQLLDAAYRVVARNRFRIAGETCAEDACRLRERAG
jgi:predicted DCC family thiol-disulfide oxidoreductase YuxK